MNKQKNLYIFFLSLFFLAGEITLLFYQTQPYTQHSVWFWTMLPTFFFSLTILFFIGKEIDDQRKHADKKEAIMSERMENASELLKETQAMYREKIKHLEIECEKLHQTHLDDQIHFDKNLEEAKANLSQILEEINLYKNRCSDMQNSLNDSIDELREVRQHYFLLQEKHAQQKNPEEPTAQYKQLREQFEEKSTVLDATRKDLFVLEGQFISLQKQKQFEELENNPNIEVLTGDLQELDQQKTLLEKEVQTLEEIVSKLLTKKKTSRKSKKSETLELQFADKTKFEQIEEQSLI